MYMLMVVLCMIFACQAQSETLDCFSCSGLLDIEDCHVIKTCAEAQTCYTETYTENNTVLYSLGCREKLFCDGMDQTHLFGRRQADPVQSGCTQCCALHGCNKYLCPVRFTAAPPPVDGSWSNWGAWGTCSPDCGIGLQFRYRECDNPAPSSNGRLCLGDAKDVSLCHNTPCPETSSTDDPHTTTTPEPTMSSTDPQTSTLTPFMDQFSSTPRYTTNDLTQAPGQCDDLIDCSSYYRPDACHGIYSAWAHKYCPVHCGFCPTASPIPCVDTIDNCHEYETDLCTKDEFWQWRETHCSKFCDLC